jgi:chemotaxis protein histidine kinase CheA
MLHEFTSDHETLEVCPIESAGTRFALLERDVIGVLTLGDDCALEQIGGVLSMQMDDRQRPLVSLREALCQPPHPSETVVVVLRVGAQLFGLLVDQALPPTRAIVHPTMDASPAFSTFTHIVRLDDGSDVAVLATTSLALSPRRGDAPAALNLAA